MNDGVWEREKLFALALRDGFKSDRMIRETIDNIKNS